MQVEINRSGLLEGEGIMKHPWIQGLSENQTPVIVLTPEALEIMQSRNTSNSSPPAVSAKLCQVCGDTARSLYFGSKACDSCRAFFKRSLHRDAYQRFTCGFEKPCRITKESRKSCQRCRFEKCRKLGMLERWRKRRMANTTVDEEEGKSSSGPDSPPPVVPNIVLPVPELLNDLEKESIQGVVDRYFLATQNTPEYAPYFSAEAEKADILDVINLFTTAVERHTHFCLMIPEFSVLNIEDQATLLKSCVFKLTMLRGATFFNPEKNCWEGDHSMLPLEFNQLKADQVKHLVSPEWQRAHLNFMTTLRNLEVDDATVILLMAIVAFTWEGMSLNDAHNVALSQAKYWCLIRKYLVWKFGPEKGFLLVGKLKNIMEMLDELADMFTTYHIRMGSAEVEFIQQKFLKLDADLGIMKTEYEIRNSLDDESEMEGRYK